MKVGDKVIWRHAGNIVFGTEVTVLWLPVQMSGRPKYGEPLALINHLGEPKLVPMRTLLPAPGPCKSSVTLHMYAERVMCRHLEGHGPLHEASVGIDPIIYLSWRS